MKKKSKLERDEGLDSQFADDMISMDVSSATDMTGAVPTPPLNEGQAEGYNNLFPVTQPVSEAAKKGGQPGGAEKEKPGSE